MSGHLRTVHVEGLGTIAELTMPDGSRHYGVDCVREADAERVVEWAETFGRHANGDPMTLSDWQRRALLNLYRGRPPGRG